MKKNLHHLGLITPKGAILFINLVYPEFESVCYYDGFRLASHRPDEVQFYYDPFHGVLEVSYRPTYDRNNNLPYRHWITIR